MTPIDSLGWWGKEESIVLREGGRDAGKWLREGGREVRVVEWYGRGDG